MFYGNSAGSGAGAWVQGACRPRFVRCVFESNTAVGMGGAVATDLEAELVLEHCEFTGNTGSSGGAVCVSVGRATIADCVITGNNGEFGGGLCMISAQDVQVHDTTIELGHASLQGGGIYASDSSFDLEDCVVTANEAGSQGGAAFLLNATAGASRCAFRDNRSGGSGGFHVDNSGLTVHSSEFVANGVGVYVVGYHRSAERRSEAGRAPVDARWNWWGDSSGPYHATLNPLGSGDEVTGGVSFDPWNVAASCGDTSRLIELSWSALKASFGE